MGSNVSYRATSLGIIHAAFNKGQPKDGVENGPRRIREGGLDKVLQSLDTKVADYGEITQPTANEPEIILNCKNQQALVKSTLELIDLVEKSVSENEMTLILGGDHSIGLGSIAGHCKAFPNSIVVWVDAHTDMNTPESSASKNTHGMPVAFALRETSKLIPQTRGFEKIKPVLENNQLIYIGIRDYDTPELQFLKELNILYFTSREVKELGITKVMEITLKTIMSCCPNARIHLSFDIDVLDPSFAPSTGTPVPEGLSLEEGKYICKTLAETGQLRSMVMAEVNPSLGSPEDATKTVNSAIEVIKSALLLD